MANGNGTINWYATPSSTLSLGTGTTFATPTLAVGPYTYYAEATTCTTSITRTPITFTISSCTGLANELQKELNVINLYPNPNNGNFIVDVKECCNIINTDPHGKVIIEKTLSVGQNDFDMNAYLNNGVYFVTVHTAGKFNYFKIVKN